MWHHHVLLVLFLSYNYLIEGCQSFVIEPKSWEFNGHYIGYEQARRRNPSPNERKQEPILLLNGFGVGSFHQHRLIANVFEKENESRLVFAVDYLGQGKSWPVDCNDGNSENEEGLVYSADMWLNQIIDFIQQVILPQCNGVSQVHIVGNSVGGYLGAVLAARRPDLVASLVLLNPTPVWGLNLPFWSGELPPPAIPRRIGRYLFDRIRDLNTIEKYLDNAYANRNAFDEELMKQIRGCTEGKGGHAAFASILWSPPATFPANAKDFQDTLAHVKCDVLLVFGKEDPWCKPAFGRKMLESLSTRQNVSSRFVELEGVGHCPNHESPQAVASLVSAWVNASDRQKDKLQLVEHDKRVTVEDWGAEIIMQEKEAADIELSLLDRIATKFV